MTGTPLNTVDFDQEFTLQSKIIIINNNHNNATNSTSQKIIRGQLDFHPTKELNSIDKISIHFKAISYQKLPTEYLTSGTTPTLDDALDDVMDHPEFIETEEVVFESSSLLYPSGEILKFEKGKKNVFQFEFEVPKEEQEEEEAEEEEKEEGDNDDNLRVRYFLELVVEQDGKEFELVQAVPDGSTI